MADVICYEAHAFTVYSCNSVRNVVKPLPTYYTHLLLGETLK